MLRMIPIRLKPKSQRSLHYTGSAIPRSVFIGREVRGGAPSLAGESRMTGLTSVPISVSPRTAEHLGAAGQDCPF
ncbi:unnamed protein product [Lota lota]